MEIPLKVMAATNGSDEQNPIRVIQIRDTVEAKEKLIDAMAQELYRANRTFRPCYPWIFIRVLAKESKIGSIYTPEKEQNKTIHEGIVIATWQPFTKEIGYRNINAELKYAVGITPTAIREAQGTLQCVEYVPLKVTRTIEKKSQFSIGQHVLFPHWAGQPIAAFNSRYYRVVKEENWEESKEGGIFAVVDYSPIAESAREKFRALLEEVVCGVPVGGPYANPREWASIAAAKIEDQFLLVDRTAGSVTLSGR